MKNPSLASALVAACLLTQPVPVLDAAESGYVVGWGHDGAGVITCNTNYMPDTISGWATGMITVAGQPLTNAVAVSAGASHALALLADGSLVGWGGNDQGEGVGYRTAPPRRASGIVKLRGEPLKGVSAVAAGRGEDRHGETAMPPDLTNIVAISAGSFHSLALKSDGTVGNWGLGAAPPPGLSNLVAVSAAGEYGRNLALTAEGRVVDWPVRSQVYNSEVPVGLSNVVAISAGWNHSLALRKDGTVVGWGLNSFGQATGISNAAPPWSATGVVKVAGQTLSNVVAIAAAHEFSLALKKDGTVVGWGSTVAGRLAVPAGLSNVVAISASDFLCLAITTNRAVAEKFKLPRD